MKGQILGRWKAFEIEQDTIIPLNIHTILNVFVARMKLAESGAHAGILPGFRKLHPGYSSDLMLQF